MRDGFGWERKFFTEESLQFQGQKHHRNDTILIFGPQYELVRVRFSQNDLMPHQYLQLVVLVEQIDSENTMLINYVKVVLDLHYIHQSVQVDSWHFRKRSDGL